MAEKPKSLIEGAPKDALSEGAARFERLIETVKAQQAAPAERPAAAGPNPLLSVSPQEEWSRRFQSQPIGPEAGGPSPGELAVIPRSALVPPLAQDLATAPRIVPERAAELAARPAGAALGARIGKPEKPRRSWFGRLIRGA